MSTSTKRIAYTTLNRRGYEVVLPTDTYNRLQEKGINLILTNQMSVQLFKNRKYIGTLKDFMGVSGFRNGNTCDFHVSNLVK